MDGHHSKTINYRPAVVGSGLAPAGQRSVDLQEIHGG
jgi:hypothetical protein